MLPLMKNRQGGNGTASCWPQREIRNKSPQGNISARRTCARKTLTGFVIGIVLALISDIPSNWGTAYLAGMILLFALVFGCLLLPERRGFRFLARDCGRRPGHRSERTRDTAARYLHGRQHLAAGVSPLARGLEHDRLVFGLVVERYLLPTNGQQTSPY